MVLIILVGTPTANWEPSVAANAEGDPREAVQAMLDGRALALQQNNLAGWMKTIDPRASAAFRNHQEASFRGLRSVPLVDYQLRLRTDDSGDLAAGSKLMEKKSADGVYLPETRQMYRLGTYDDRPVVDTMWWTYVLRDGRWYVSADDDLRSIGLDTARQLWDFGPVLTRQTEHFLVITKPQDSVRGQSLALVAEEAMAQFQSRWNRPW